MRQQRIRECIAALVAEKMRKTLQSFAITGKLMGLLIGDHLQPVLNGPEKAVGRSEVLAGERINPLALRQRFKHVQGAPTAQLGMAAARHQLLGLNEELNFANATTAKLD